MSTRTNVNLRKPLYKDYTQFVESYRNGPRKDYDGASSVITSDSGVNFSLNSSENNSSSSVFSDLSEASQNGKPATKTVKSEIFIEIKSPVVQTFELSGTGRVEEMSKVFQQPTSKTKQTSIGELQKKFEEPKASHVRPVRPVLKRAASIGKVSKIFEHPVVENVQARPKNNFNTIPKPFQLPTMNEKPAILSPKPLILSSKQYTTIDLPGSYADSVDSALSSMSPSSPHCVSPPPMPINNQIIKSTNLPSPPPPPPLPPSDFGIKPNKTTSSKPATKITVHNNGTSPMNGTIDRNDPRVKKAVYGALRQMYGTYHDQANDYLATLPKNRVKKNNGLDSIINSIASQGGLDKLNGRANPKKDVE